MGVGIDVLVAVGEGVEVVVGVAVGILCVGAHPDIVIAKISIQIVISFIFAAFSIKS
jgi:hypothetical protein